MELEHYFTAQRALIGAAILDPSIAGELFCEVSEEDYSVPELRTLFLAEKDLFLHSQSIDPVILVEKTGASYDRIVREVIQDTPTAANWRAYAKALREGAQLRRLQEIGVQLTGAVNAEDARQILASSETQMLTRPKAKTANISELLGQFYLRQQDGEKPSYLPWGIRQLDKTLTAEPGDFIILGADSSVGKTAFACQLAWTMAASGRRVGFFSLETSARKLTDRIAAQRAKVELEKIKHKQLDAADYRNVIEAGKSAGRMVLEITEAAGFTVADVRALTLAKRYDVIFIDYVQLLAAAGSERWEIVTRISMELHTMAQQTGVIIIALSQLTPPDKKSGRRNPTKDDLRESRQLKQDADIILLMSLDNPDDNDSDRWLTVAKNKDGACGKLMLHFEAEHMEFIAWGTPRVQYEKVSEQEEIPFD